MNSSEESEYKKIIYCRMPSCRHYKIRQEGFLYHGICTLEGIFWVSTEGKCLLFREPKEVILGYKIL